MSECHSIHFHIQRGRGGGMASPCSPSLSLSFVMGVKGCSLTHAWGMSGWMGDKHSPCSSSISFTRGVSRCHSIHLHIQRECESGLMGDIHFPCTRSVDAIPSACKYKGNEWADGNLFLSLFCDWCERMTFRALTYMGNEWMDG